MRGQPSYYQWSIIIALAVGFGLFLSYFHVPAAMLLGSMLIGISMSLVGSTVQVPIKCFIAAQSILGCMVAQSLSAEILIPLQQHWFIILIVLLMTLVASTLTGWLLIRFSHLPGSTGAWGTAPGGASAMVAMSVDYGADMRLVAFIQYSRVLLVIATTVIVAHIVNDTALVISHAQTIWFPPITSSFVKTVTIGIIGAWIGRKFSIPSGAMIVPMIVATFFQTEGWIILELPEWLLAFAYVSIGLSVGLKFNVAVLRLAFRSLPQILFSIVLLMAVCALSAYMLHIVAGTDLLTAYLATSPGGLDTVAIIATGTGSDLSIIISIQSLRLLSVLLIGPLIAKFLAKWARVPSN